MFKYTLFLTFWHLISRHNANYGGYDCDDDDDVDVRLPITSLLTTNTLKDERIATRKASLLSADLHIKNTAFHCLISLRFFIKQIKKLSTLFVFTISRSMA